MDDWLLEIPTIPLSKHPLILSFLHHTYYWTDNRIPPPLDISLETYEKLMREHPKWESCLSILPGYKREYLSKSGKKRIVLLCHEDFIKIAYCEDKNCKLIIYDLKCPQCEQRKIIPERSHTYVSSQNGKIKERFRIHFLCGHIIEGVIDEKTRQVFF